MSNNIMSDNIIPDNIMSNNSTSSLKPENPDPSLFNLPPLPPSLSESLTSGTSIPAPPPSPPPPKFVPIVTPEKHKSSLSRPITPTTVPVASPSPSMPGTFPVSPTPSPKPQPQTPQTFGKTTYTASAYASSPIPYSPGTPNSKSPKRPSSLRNLLSFKRAHTASPESQSSPSSPRPGSAGGSSLASSFRPGINGRKSGTFWLRRKSSLGMYTNGTGQDEPSSPGPNGHDTVYEDEAEHKSPIDSPNPNSPTPTLSKRKSMGFWRRKSSLALGADEQKQHHLDQTINGNHLPQNPTPAHITTTPAIDQHREPPADSPPLPEPRSWSPPPVLPEVMVKEGGFWDADDMFGHIR